MAASGGTDESPYPRAEYANLDPKLREVAWAYDDWLASGKPESEAPFKLDWEVGAFIWIPSNLEGVLAFLEENDVYNTKGRYEGVNNTLAFLPVTLVGAVSNQAGVSSVQMMFPPEPPTVMDPTPVPWPTRAPTPTRAARDPRSLEPTSTPWPP